MKTILLTIIFLIPMTLRSQEQNTTQSTNQYLEKSIRQKKTANVLAITGGGLVLAGVIVAATIPKQTKGWEGFNQGVTAVGIGGVGAITALISIPFYISSHNNKKKSVSISPQTGSVNIDQKNYATAGIAINF